MIEWFIGFIVGLTCGVLIGAVIVLRNPRTKPPDDEQTILVKRTRASFRNPARTSRTTFEPYRTNKDGRYSPIRLGKGSVDDERQVEGKKR